MSVVAASYTIVRPRTSGQPGTFRLDLVDSRTMRTKEDTLSPCYRLTVQFNVALSEFFMAEFLQK